MLRRAFTALLAAAVVLAYTAAGNRVGAALGSPHAYDDADSGSHLRDLTRESIRPARVVDARAAHGKPLALPIAVAPSSTALVLPAGAARGDRTRVTHSFHRRRHGSGRSTRGPPAMLFPI